jgi:RNA 2',3'-cyclic 3'-phosphodiesterase
MGDTRGRANDSSGAAPALRLFFAVDVRCPAALRRVVIDLGGLGRAVKAVDPDQLHVTLKFLGATPADLVPRLADVLSHAEFPAAFDVSLVGLGAFPSAQRPSVLWAGLEPVGPLQQMARTLEAAVEPLGFARESRPFRPHVTVARVRFRPPPAVGALLLDEAATNFGSVRIDSVVLYRSDTTTHGPQYTRLARVALSDP